ncbi:MAG: hypothetical protein ACFE7E_08965, partial [Candidatus Hodarchaeota archaeon]
DRYIFSEPYCVAYDYLTAALGGARVCVIIGQSGRDETIKRSLWKAARQNSELHFLVITLGRIPPHLEDVLPNERVELWSDGFDERAVAWVINRARQLL